MKLWVSDLDRFAHWKNPPAPWADQTPAQFLRDLRTRPDSAAMRLGRAFHKIMENMDSAIDRKASTHVDRERWTIFFPGDLKTIKTTFQEQRNELVVNDQIRITGRIDGGYDTPTGALGLVDYKTTQSSRAKGEDLMASWQWRAYLCMTDAYEFRYEVYRLKAGEQSATVVDQSVYTFHRYNGIEDDVKGWAREVAKTAQGLGWSGR